MRLVGEVPHDLMPAYFSSADVFVVGSHHEGSGYALMEACACGTVPVVTSIPSFMAMTADGRIGAAWTPGDAGDLARALADVCRRDLGALGRGAIEHADRALRWPAIGTRAMTVYRDVIARRRAQRTACPAA